MRFNEDTRVKIPSIIHLTRLGYSYLPLRGASWDGATNVFPDIFRASLARINRDCEADQVERALQQIPLLLDYEDLGKAFFERLTSTSGLRFIDFENFDNNSFHVATELTYRNGDDEFRPDISLLINGMPLAFIEVKKPNNRDGILAERARIIRRCQNPKFRRFMNITQMMVFSNNMEYDLSGIDSLAGAFYAAFSDKEPDFNYFREEEKRDLSRILAAEDPEIEQLVLADNNLTAIRHSPEYQTNRDQNTPTNRLSTALFSRDRLAFLLRFAFAYVRTETGLEKHIMRYPQIFATKAIACTLEVGIRKGIIWHTQGSGKTALAYWNVLYLIAWFQARAVVPKFYFIVDRIDLLLQAAHEFRSRGLVVHTIATREAFKHDIKSPGAIHIHSLAPKGRAAIVVPTGFVTAQSGIEMAIRQHLVEHRMLAGVVSMPSNIFATTGTNVSILFLDAANKDSIVLIDASALGTKVKEGKNQKTVLSTDEEDRIIKTFNAKQSVEDFSVVVSYEDIAAKNYSLSAGQYFDIKVEHSELTPKQFERELAERTARLKELFNESSRLEKQIGKSLGGLRRDN